MCQITDVKMQNRNHKLLKSSDVKLTSAQSYVASDQVCDNLSSVDSTFIIQITFYLGGEMVVQVLNVLS